MTRLAKTARTIRLTPLLNLKPEKLSFHLCLGSGEEIGVFMGDPSNLDPSENFIVMIFPNSGEEVKTRTRLWASLLFKTGPVENNYIGGK